MRPTGPCMFSATTRASVRPRPRCGRRRRTTGAGRSASTCSASPTGSSSSCPACSRVGKRASSSTRRHPTGPSPRCRRRRCTPRPGPTQREPHGSPRSGSLMSNYSVSSKYMVISSDGHAGPPAAVYREYLDPAFREKFDEHQAALDAGRMVNTDFVKEWDDETGDVELKAAFDPAVRDTILDQEGVAAEVLFPDADVLGTGRAASSPV